MVEIKISDLITNFDFVVGIMKITENKTVENFIKLLLLYKKLKNQTVSKSSIRLIIEGTEYGFSIEKKLPFEPDFEGDDKNLYPEAIENENVWNKTLTDGLIRNIIINHYKI